MSIEAKLEELGLKLPDPPAVAGSYVPFVRTGNLLYLAGTISSFNGKMTHTGQAGKEQTVQTAYESAKICALNTLANIKAATGSNLYFDEIKQNGRWVSQKKKSTKGDIEEETGYSYYGTTENGLLVVLASYSGGGSGDFAMLHILDIAAGRALDLEGKTYERINLTNVRSIALGDRWDGEVRIAKSAVRIITTRKGPADDSGKRETLTIDARRP